MLSIEGVIVSAGRRKETTYDILVVFIHKNGVVSMDPIQNLRPAHYLKRRVAVGVYTSSVL